MAGAPHHRLAAESADLVEQALAGLDVGDDGGPGHGGQHVAGQDRQDLVAPDHPALPVDGADAVAVAVERQAQVQPALAHHVLQLGQVGFHGRVGVVGGKGAVDVGVEGDMLARQAAGDVFDRLAGGPVAGVPGHLQGRAVEVAQQAVDVAVEDVDLLDAALAVIEVAGGGGGPQGLDVPAIAGLLADHHLEAVVVRRIVRSGDHHAAVGVQLEHGVIQHRRGPQADPLDRQPGGDQPVHQRGLQGRRA